MPMPATVVISPSVVKETAEFAAVERAYTPWLLELTSPVTSTVTLPPACAVTPRLAVDVKSNDTREDYVRSKLIRTVGGLLVEPHPVQDSSILSVLAWSTGLLVRPAHDPARKAGESVQVIDLSVLPGAY